MYFVRVGFVRNLRVMYLVFDCETKGLPNNRKAPITDTANYPRIIQLAWQLYDKNRRLVQEYSRLIKPDGWTVPTGEFWQLNGYRTDINEAKGVPIVDALNSLRNAVGGGGLYYSAQYRI